MPQERTPRDVAQRRMKNLRRGLFWAGQAQKSKNPVVVFLGVNSGLGNTPLYDSHSECFFGPSGGGQIPGPIRSAKVPPFQLRKTQPTAMY